MPSLQELYSAGQMRGSGLVYTTERRPRRPGEDEIRRGQTRTSYTGDDLFISVARPAGAKAIEPIRRLDIRALCTNRDMPILDDSPRLTLETGDPVRDVRLLQAFRRPRASLQGRLAEASGGDDRFDDLDLALDLALALNHLSLAEAGAEAEPLHALLALYADRGDPAYARFARAVTRVRSAPVIERLPHAGPMCFAHGTEITLDIDDGMFSGGSRLLLSAILSRLLCATPRSTPSCGDRASRPGSGDRPMADDARHARPDLEALAETTPSMDFFELLRRLEGGTRRVRPGRRTPTASPRASARVSRLSFATSDVSDSAPAVRPRACRR